MVKLQRAASRRECGVDADFTNGVVFIPVTVLAIFFLRAVLLYIGCDADMRCPLVVLRESYDLLYDRLV